MFSNLHWFRNKNLRKKEEQEIVKTKLKLFITGHIYNYIYITKKRNLPISI